MDCSNGMPNAPQLVLCQNKDEAFSTHQRRSANYKPNIWKYDHIESLTCEYNEEKYGRRVEKLKEEVLCMFVEGGDQILTKLQLIDNIEKLGLSYLFEEEIKDALDSIVSIKNNNLSIDEGLYATALCFRLLRQHGYNVLQDMFKCFFDEKSTFLEGTNSDVKAVLELYEASHLAFEGEKLLDQAKTLSTTILNNTKSNLDDQGLAKLLAHALQLPLQWRVQWYDVKKQIHMYEKETEQKYSILLELAKLNFNVVQATHQRDLKEIARWWRNLSIGQHLTFTRDRLVESYLWSVGVAFEPQNGSLRKWLTKAINFVIIIDDIYDVYGSLQELECFTNAVERWDFKEIQQLPECMRTCFEALYNTTNEVANEIQKEKELNSVLPHLQKVWADFCKSMLEEAKWYNKGYTPSLEEYLENGWISSSGPVLSLHAFFSVTHEGTEEIMDCLKNCEDLVFHTSMIVRLCNDLGTSTAELERGDAPSSILCFMRESNVSEENARKHVKSLIMDAWKKINSHCITISPSLQWFVEYTTNVARVAQFIYQNGDGFGVQDRETRQQVLSLLIEPLELN